ncbi:hypothetical protein [Nocardioides guangzhouensis]|uniref:hypothetical protein n=1 Tax=Nocardioides guangzhouensis TaxID=2497878 RepID=UPI001438345F|nr:hypothetical protein [Nocardioides guangzhouensis]
MTSRRTPVLAAVLLAVLVAACDGDGSPSVEPTRSPTIEPTRTPSVPSPTRTVTRPTGEPTPPTTGPTTEPTTEPTTPPTTEPTEPTGPPTTPPTTPSTPPTTPPTTEPTTEPPATPTEPSTPTEGPTSAPTTPAGGSASEGKGDDEGFPAWLGWLLAALAVLTAVGVPVLVVGRRRRRWRADLAAAEAEVAWLARDLLPELRDTGTRDGAAGGWQVGGAGRVAAVEDRLTVLEASAPGDAERARATALRDAVRAARSRVEQALSPGATAPVPPVLDAVVADLEQALRVPATDGGPAPA